MRESPPSIDDVLGTVAVLADDVRRRLFFIVREATQPVTRDEVANAAGISRKLAAFHLEKLVGAGLVEVSGSRAPERVPRPGRSPKLYQRSGAQIELNIPARHGDLMAAILLSAIGLGGDPLTAALAAAHDRGRESGRAVRGSLRPGRLGPERALRLAMQALTDQGYEPVVPASTGETEIVLRNCPFRRLVEVDRSVCAINRSLVAGVLVGLDTDLLAADVVSGEGRCCVTVTVRVQSAAGGKPPAEADGPG